jgi:hypothetical protein
MHVCKPHDSKVERIALGVARQIHKRRGVSSEQAIQAAIAIIIAAIDRESKGEYSYIRKAIGGVEKSLHDVAFSREWQKVSRLPEEAAKLAIHLGIDFSLPGKTSASK